MLILLLFSSAFIKAQAAAAEAEKITLNLKNVELERALIMLANLGEQNLICDQSVAGKITVIFNEIDFEDALNLITDSFNLDYLIENETIFISTAEKIAAKNIKISTRKYQLNHLSSEKAVEILNSNFSELKMINLDSEGVIITAEAEKLEKIEQIIQKIDRPQKQILIKARLEEISRNRIKELGINPDQLSKLRIIKDDSNNIDEIKLSWPDTLKMLEEEGASNILANPSLMTVDRKKAKLVIGDQIPVKLESVVEDKTVSTLNYIEAGIVLEFLPKILNEEEVLLEIKPAVNSIGQVMADGLPAVNSRSAETTVILKDGQTLAIGGLIKRDYLTSEKAVPVLSELPFLGSLFSSSETTDLESELIIFITPEIITADSYSLKAENLKDKARISENMSKKKQESGQLKENNNYNREFITLSQEEIKEILDK